MARTFACHLRVDQQSPTSHQREYHWHRRFLVCRLCAHRVIPSDDSRDGSESYPNAPSITPLLRPTPPMNRYLFVTQYITGILGFQELRRGKGVKHMDTTLGILNAIISPVHRVSCASVVEQGGSYKHSEPDPRPDRTQKCR